MLPLATATTSAERPPPQHTALAVARDTDAGLPGPLAALPDDFATIRAALDTTWTGAGPDGLDAICRYALRSSGKLLRPALLRLSAAAVGGDVESVLPAALGTEYGHVASLVHDDVIDDDLVRRGAPSVYAAYGTDRAIVAGDALLFALFGALAECRTTGVPDERIVSTLAVVADAGVDLCRGQLLEAEIAGDLDCGVETYLRMVSWKTGALFRAACVSGAVLGGASPAFVAAFADYGVALGVAYQIADDLLAYTSSQQATGKAAASDLRNLRVTLPVLLAAQAGPRWRGAVAAVFGAAAAGDVGLGDLTTIVRTSGALAAAARVAGEWAERAVAAVEPLPESDSRDALRHIARYAVGRER